MAAGCPVNVDWSHQLVSPGIRSSGLRTDPSDRANLVIEEISVSDAGSGLLTAGNSLLTAEGGPVTGPSVVLTGEVSAVKLDQVVPQIGHPSHFTQQNTMVNTYY